MSGTSAEGDRSNFSVLENGMSQNVQEKISGADFQKNAQAERKEIGENTEIKRKAPSFFERLTGIKRPFSSNKREEYSVQPQVKSSQMMKTQEEDLEIPAFLRRNS